MTTEPTLTQQEHPKPRVIRQGSGSDAVYAIGIIGAWVYYLRRAPTFRQRIRGFFQGLFWPAFLVYELLVFLEKECPANFLGTSGSNKISAVSNAWGVLSLGWPMDWATRLSPACQEGSYLQQSSLSARSATYR